jgi:Sulfotransferase family
MTLPTFLVIGAMKSGTTSLYDYLASHPQVFMARPKELHFFTEGKNWRRGRAWYEGHFAGAERAPARGEASPSYSQADIFPGVPDRIAEVLPDVRLVYIVRHPIERMCSMYLHQVASGLEPLPVADAFRANAYYLNASRYSWQLDQHLERVPPERIKVITTDALRDEPKRTLADLFAFIGVDPARAPTSPARRGQTERKRMAVPLKARLARIPGYAALKRAAPQPVRRAIRQATTRPVDPAMADLPADLEAELAEQLRPDVARLRRFLGADFDGWGLLAG